MRRPDKYPDTEYFHYHNENPKNRITGDCAFRAIAKGLEQDYRTTVMEMAQMMCETGYALNDKKGEDKYLKSKGWGKHYQPKKPDGTKYTGKEFCRLLEQYSNPRFGKNTLRGNVIAHIGGHHIVVFVREENRKYRCYDIWDCTEGCIGNFWVKED